MYIHIYTLIHIYLYTHICILKKTKLPVVLWYNNIEWYRKQSSLDCYWSTWYGLLQVSLLHHHASSNIFVLMCWYSHILQKSSVHQYSDIQLHIRLLRDISWRACTMAWHDRLNLYLKSQHCIWTLISATTLPLFAFLDFLQSKKAKKKEKKKIKR